MIGIALEALAAVALLAIGVLTGWVARGRQEEGRQLVRSQQAQLERQRIVHDTKRVSVARPGTKPGRITKATIDMGASHMQQHGREVE